MSVNQFFKYFFKIRKDTQGPIVTFVCRITFLKNWSNISILYKIREIFIYYTVIESFRQSLRICMNPFDHDFNQNVFKRTGLIFREFFNYFQYFVLLKFTTSKLFFAIKMLLNHFDRLVFQLLQLIFLRFVIQSSRCLFQLQSFSQFMKYLLKLCDIFLLSFIVL